MTNQKIREAFEKTFSKPPYEFNLMMYGTESAWPGNYANYHVQCAWEAYQAALSSPPEGWKLVKESDIRWIRDDAIAGEGLICNEALVLLDRILEERRPAPSPSEES